MELHYGKWIRGFVGMSFDIFWGSMLFVIFHIVFSFVLGK